MEPSDSLLGAVPPTQVKQGESKTLRMQQRTQASPSCGGRTRALGVLRMAASPEEETLWRGKDLKDLGWWGVLGHSGSRLLDVIWIESSQFDESPKSHCSREGLSDLQWTGGICCALCQLLADRQAWLTSCPPIFLVLMVRTPFGFGWWQSHNKKQIVGQIKNHPKPQPPL